MKPWLLFEDHCDGELYLGAFASIAEAKLKAVERWGGSFYDSFHILSTEDEDYYTGGETKRDKKGRAYLDWSDEKPTDVSTQREKIERFAQDEADAAERKAALLKKRGSGAKLSLAERMTLSMYDQQEEMLANILNNCMTGKIWPDGAPIVSADPPQGVRP